MNGVTLAEVRRLVPEAKKNNAMDLGFYSLTWLPLVASTANVPATVTTQGDSDIILMAIAAYATTNAAPPVENATPQATFTLQVGSRLINPDGVAMHVAPFAVATAKEWGVTLPFPLYVQRNTTLKALATNLTATDIMLRILLVGVQLFNREPGPGELGGVGV